LAIGYGGQKVSSIFKFAVNPNGWFKKGLGVLLVLTGLMILTGFDKTIEIWILDAGYLGPIQLEQNLINNFE
jgi:cytochrome c-type biogenesis protein